MDDLIRRRDTISAMEETDWYHINRDGQLVHGANSKEDEPLYRASDVYKVLNAMPSAQPETHEKRTETHSCDCISRSMAVNAVQGIAHVVALPDDDDVIRKSAVKHVLLHLPSAQPEILKDGTLMIDVPDLDKVNRVFVGNGRWCKMFYMDDSEREADG